MGLNSENTQHTRVLHAGAQRSVQCQTAVCCVCSSLPFPKLVIHFHKSRATEQLSQRGCLQKREGRRVRREERGRAVEKREGKEREGSSIFHVQRISAAKCDT